MTQQRGCERCGTPPTEGMVKVGLTSGYVCEDCLKAEQEAKEARQRRFNRAAGAVVLALLALVVMQQTYSQGRETGYSEGAREGAEVCRSAIAYRFEDGTDWREVVAELQEETFCNEALRENGVIP